MPWGMEVAGEGVRVGDGGGVGGATRDEGGGLELSVSSRDEAVRNGYLIRAGEVMARRSDMARGSYRVGVRIAKDGVAGGTCFGVFWVGLFAVPGAVATFLHARSRGRHVNRYAQSTYPANSSI